MNWNNIFTHAQRRNLLNATRKAAEDFLSFVKTSGFTGEAVIKQFAYALVVNGGKFYEKRYLHEKSTVLKRDEYGYESLSDLNDKLIEIEYRLTPEDFAEARNQVAQKITEDKKAAELRIDTEKEASKELCALLGSRAKQDLICDIRLTRKINAMGTFELYFGKHGLYQVQLEPIFRKESLDYRFAIKEYNLTAKQLRDLREKIEALV